MSEFASLAMIRVFERVYRATGLSWSFGVV
jgi:hypothetical protein